MRIPVVLLLALLVLVSGCVVTYGNFPDVRADDLPKHRVLIPVSYDVDYIPATFMDNDTRSTTSIITFPNLYPMDMKDFSNRGRDVIETTLKTSEVFPELFAVEIPPNVQDDPVSAANKRMHIRVTFDVDSPSSDARGVVTTQSIVGGALAQSGLALLAWTPIPYYSGEGGLRVRYQLYREYSSYATYEYTIKKKGAGGLLLLPLAWLNLFTDDLKDALRATTLQFLIDAHRDGNL